MEFDKGLDHWLDILVVVLYFVFVIGVGIWTLWRPTRSSIKGYFLAGREMIWFPVGASLYASNIGSEHFIGLAGTGAASGIAIVLYEWASMPLVMLLAWLFLPVYLSAGVYTLPEYLQKRFGGSRLRIYLSCLSLLLYVVTKIAVSIFAGALFIQMALGWDMYVSIVVLLTITGLYTVMGGLAAVIYTDAVQCVIMTIGAIVLTIMSFQKAGGYENVRFAYMQAVPTIRDQNTTCGEPRADAFNLFRHPLYGDNPWPGILLQSTIGCLWYWCSDQVIVQRALAAKNVSHAKGGAILAGYLKLLPLFLMIFPGMISRIIYPDDVACADPVECERICGNPTGCSNIAYPLLVMTLLPIGIRGLLIAVMLSAIMSSLTSIFNSSATLFTMDLWRRVRKQATERELLLVGRVAIVVLCIVSVLWIPLIKSSAGGQLFVYIQAIQGYLGTPIGALFLLAVFWKRMNEYGAFFGILFGHGCGCIRMVLDFVYPEPSCGSFDTRPPIVKNLHYTYFSQINLLMTMGVIVIVSLLTPAPDERKMAGVTWWTRRQRPEVATEVQTKAEENDHDVLHKVDSGIVPMENDQSSTPTPKIATNGLDDKHYVASHEQCEEIPLPSVKQSVWRRWIEFACGLPHEGEHGKPRENYEERMKLLEEKPIWRRVVNVNAVVAMGITVFLLGFYH